MAAGRCGRHADSLDGVAFLSDAFRSIWCMDAVIEGMGPGELMERLTADVAALQSLDLDALTVREELALVRAVEILRRRLDHGSGCGGSWTR